MMMEELPKLRRETYCVEIRSRVTKTQYQTICEAVNFAVESGQIKDRADFIRRAVVEYALQFKKQEKNQTPADSASSSSWRY
ncbi:MAG: hypothetical protein PXY39_02125 [archaeon]|nr:hypothetical protein [archaeon]